MSDRWYYQYNEDSRVYQVVPYYYPYDNSNNSNNNNNNSGNTPMLMQMPVTNGTSSVSRPPYVMVKDDAGSNKTTSTQGASLQMQTPMQMLPASQIMPTMDYRSNSMSIGSISGSISGPSPLHTANPSIAPVSINSTNSSSTNNDSTNSNNSTNTHLHQPPTALSYTSSESGNNNYDDSEAKKMSRLKFKSSVMKDGDLEKNEYTLGVSDTAARRRKQNREAQRAYRERKATRIIELEKTVEMLQNTIKDYDLQMSTFNLRLQSLQEKNELLENMNKKLIANGIECKSCSNQFTNDDYASIQNNKLKEETAIATVDDNSNSKSLMDSINKFEPMTAVSLKKDEPESRKRTNSHAFLQIKSQTQKQLSTPVSPDNNALLLGNNETVDVEENEIDMNYMAKKPKTSNKPKEGCCGKSKEKGKCCSDKPKNWTPGSCGKCKSDPYSKAFCQSVYAEKKQMNGGREVTLIPSEVQKMRNELIKEVNSTTNSIDSDIYMGTPAAETNDTSVDSSYTVKKENRCGENRNCCSDNLSGAASAAITPISPMAVSGKTDNDKSLPKSEEHHSDSEITIKKESPSVENLATDSPTSSTFQRIRKQMEYKKNFPTTGIPTDLGNILTNSN